MSTRLATESSPYLRQHADNPVEWWPWSDEAFAEAKRLDKPVLRGARVRHVCPTRLARGPNSQKADSSVIG